MPTIKKILAPTDFTDTAENAVDYAVDLAASLGATVQVVYVFEPPVYSFAEAVLVAPPEITAKLSDKAQEMLDAAVESRRPRCASISGVLLNGAAWEEIGRLAAEKKFDLIVMGTHGRQGLARAVLGSVAEKVLRTSTVPVLAVHSPQKGT